MRGSIYHLWDRVLFGTNHLEKSLNQTKFFDYCLSSVSLPQFPDVHVNLQLVQIQSSFDHKEGVERLEHLRQFAKSLNFFRLPLAFPSSFDTSHQAFSIIAMFHLRC